MHIKQTEILLAVSYAIAAHSPDDSQREILSRCRWVENRQFLQIVSPPSIEKPSDPIYSIESRELESRSDVTTIASEILKSLQHIAATTSS